MKWYLAKIVFRIICGEGSHKAQFDEQLRLVWASNEECALEKAVSWGKQEEERFLNDKHQLVYWKFVNVSELYTLSELIDGAELYSQIKESDRPDHYTDTVHKKFEHIRAKTTHQILQLL